MYNVLFMVLCFYIHEKMRYETILFVFFSPQSSYFSRLFIFLLCFHFSSCPDI